MTSLSKAQGALDRASDLINGPRQESYGPPQENFKRIAARWAQVFGHEVEMWRVALAMAELKLARLANGWHEDSIDDAIAYLALMKELKDDS